MRDLGLWEAWRLWCSGAKLENFAMWGVPMLWWARIGKLIQYTGGLVVIFDVIGPDKFRRASLRLKARARYHFPFFTGRYYFGMVATFGYAIFVLLWVDFQPFVVPGLSDWLPDFARTAAVLTCILATVLLTPWILRAIARFVALGKYRHIGLILSFVLVTAGFQLDLLGL